MHPAIFAEHLANGQIRCILCAHECRLKPGQTGICQVRHNVAGQLVTSVYGRPVMQGVEPVEKKYLFHAFPGTHTLSLGTPGCNLRCHYCVNWRVSQRGSAAEQFVSPADVVASAQQQGAQGIAFTYTEPTIFIEYAHDIAQHARAAGLYTVAKSNGYMTAAALTHMAAWLDAVNFDLKGWQNAPHRRIIGGDVQPVLDNLRLARNLGLWIEVSTLVVPGLSDTLDELAAIAHFIANALGTETPWHLLRFFPTFEMADQPATAQHLLQAAVEVGQQAGLRYIYSKDLPHQRMTTRCPQCQTIVMQRTVYELTQTRLDAGRCAVCQHPIAGIGLGASDHAANT